VTTRIYGRGLPAVIFWGAHGKTEKHLFHYF
jgi:hypothetical protein